MERKKVPYCDLFLFSFLYTYGLLFFFFLVVGWGYEMFRKLIKQRKRLLNFYFAKFGFVYFYCYYTQYVVISFPFNLLPCLFSCLSFLLLVCPVNRVIFVIGGFVSLLSANGLAVYYTIILPVKVKIDFIRVQFFYN